jgi:MoxR-like ATPase
VENAINETIKKLGQDNDWVREALRQAALANASFDDRVWVTVDDVAEIAELVLGHRISDG